MGLRMSLFDLPVELFQPIINRVQPLTDSLEGLLISTLAIMERHRNLEPSLASIATSLRTDCLSEHRAVR